MRLGSGLLLTLILSGCGDSDTSSSASSNHDYNIDFHSYSRATSADHAVLAKEVDTLENATDIGGDEPQPDGTFTKLHSGGGWDPAPEKVGPLRGDARRRQLHHTPMINRMVRKHKYDYFFIHAIITAESMYKERVVSKGVGAAGLMQIMPDTAVGLGISPEQRFNPEANVDAGIRYFKQMKWAKGNMQALAAGYNSGPARARALLEQNTSSRYWRSAQVSTRNGVPGPKYHNGETYTYARRVAGYYLLYKSNPDLIGFGVSSPSSGSAVDARGLDNSGGGGK